MDDLAHRAPLVRALRIGDRVQVPQHSHSHREIAVDNVLARPREALPLSEGPGGTVEAVRENADSDTGTVDPELRACEIAPHRAISLAGGEPDSRRGQ